MTEYERRAKSSVVVNFILKSDYSSSLRIENSGSGFSRDNEPTQIYIHSVNLTCATLQKSLHIEAAGNSPWPDFISIFACVLQ